ncbi:Splicing factor-like protein [Trema orientale]|uniref:Splicing factor-like protein n=1 Tax=Trema orientale TaxID=63057 RepID=A0A2P5CE78_TREOI|nr:Splicing factor-like protein [Trema orientale]
MASTVQQAPAGSLLPTADVVGNAFVHQYYLILHKSPELVHRFYQDGSKLGRPEDNGIMSVTTTMQAINEKIVSLDYGKFSADITTVDAQDSYNGGVFVLVTGYLTGKDNLRRKFTQSFFLAPQDTGYFVLNDVFRYVDDAGHQNGNQALVNDVELPLTPERDSSTVLENHTSEPAIEVSDDVNEEEVYDPENGEVEVEEEEAPLEEVVDVIPDDQKMAETNSKIEEVPKKSYASILKVMKESAVPSSAPPPPPLRTAQKNEEPMSAALPPLLPLSDTVAPSANVNENGNNQENQEVEAESHSIYIKGLPLSATNSLLENEFKKFGPIKNNGVQVRSQKGFCFGFVEFETASAVQSAIEASPITINGRPVVVEEKRSTNRGKFGFVVLTYGFFHAGNRGRFSSSRGNGYRSEGTRGRGYGGGRGYGRGDFNGRSDFGSRNGNRGGASRGGDGYQRAENGGRVNRTGGLGVNSAAKNSAVRVSATA